MYLNCILCILIQKFKGEEGPAKLTRHRNKNELHTKLIPYHTKKIVPNDFEHRTSK